MREWFGTVFFSPASFLRTLTLTSFSSSHRDNLGSQINSSLLVPAVCLNSRATMIALPSGTHSQCWVLYSHPHIYFFHDFMKHPLYTYLSDKLLRHVPRSQGYCYALLQNFQSRALWFKYLCSYSSGHRDSRILDQLLFTTHTSKNYYISTLILWVKLSHAKDRNHQEDGLFDWLAHGSKENYFTSMIIKTAFP